MPLLSQHTLDVHHAQLHHQLSSLTTTLSTHTQTSHSLSQELQRFLSTFPHGNPSTHSSAKPHRKLFLAHYAEQKKALKRLKAEMEAWEGTARVLVREITRVKEATLGYRRTYEERGVLDAVERGWRVWREAEVAVGRLRMEVEEVWGRWGRL